MEAYTLCHDNGGNSGAGYLFLRSPCGSENHSALSFWTGLSLLPVLCAIVPARTLSLHCLGLLSWAVYIKLFYVCQGQAMLIRQPEIFKKRATIAGLVPAHLMNNVQGRPADVAYHYYNAIVAPGTRTPHSQTAGY